MKISLLEPKSPGLHVFSKARMPRLGLPLIATLLEELGHNVRVFVEEIKEPDFGDLLNSDLVGFSSTTSTIPRAYRIADRLKRKRPDLPIVFGGPHVTFLPEEALEHGDFCILGEGEESFLDLIRAIEKGESPEEISGLAFKDNGHIRINKRRKPVDLDSLPFPKLDLIEGYKKLKISPLTQKVFPLETSRGCPFGCRFCSVIRMFGRNYRFRNLENLISRLQNIPPKQPVFFYDDNFAADPDRAKKLLKKMIEKEIKLEWSAQVRANISEDTELLDLMEETGASMVHIGFESINPKTLEEYKKNLTPDEIEQTIREFHKRGIRIHGMFIVGGDEDDPQTASRIVDFALDQKLDTIQLLMLTPIPGTPLFEDLKENNRLLSAGWEYYDGHHVVHNPAQMTPYELQSSVIKEMARFYSFRQLMRLGARWDLVNSYFRFYGWKTIKKWIADRKNQAYLTFLKETYSKV